MIRQMKQIHVTKSIIIGLLTCLLISCQKEPKTIAVTGITLSQTSVEITEGESTHISATISPSNATNKTVIWSSDNPFVTVSDGTITGTKPCSATVTAKSDDGGKTASCSVRVVARVIHVSSVSLDNTSLTLTEGDTQALTVTISPSDATDPSVTWSSDNESVATVSSSGVVSAKAPGKATITVKSNDGGKVATCSVTVQAKVIAVTGVSLNETSLTMTEGDTYTLTATVSPNDATDKSVMWSSSNSTVVEVSSTGVVIARSTGSATITVKTTDGGKTASCSVTVNAKVIPVTGVSLDKTSLTMTEGDNQILTATVTPSNATTKYVTWSSSDPSVVGVSSSGIVFAESAGSATITVKTVDGGKTASCYVVVNKKVIPVSAVSLNKTSLSLSKGQSETLTATVSPSDATDKTITWSSSNTSVASVDQNGKVSALAGGSATITAKAGDKQATCTVTVTVPVNSVSLDRTSIELTEGESITLVATVKPDDATDKKVTWSCANTSVATVDQNGKVTAIKEGTTNITAKVGDKIATCVVKVSKKVIPVASVSLNKTSLSLTKGQSETLTATVSPSDATDKTVTWSSSNTSVATVDQNGKVTAVGGGSATITAKAGDKQATCTVTVTVPVTSVTLNKSSLALNKGQYETLTATVSPSDATDKTVTWSSSNTSVATVDQNGKVTAVGGGSATITAKAGDKQATCTVTITVPVTSVTLNKSSLALNKGQSETLTATVSPSDASDKKVIWSSSNTSVATVDQNGKVTAVAGGSATITAKAGDKQATCTVTVTVPVTSISLDRTSIELTEGGSIILVAMVKPDDATDKKVTWSSANTSIATVDQNGKVTAIKEGTTTISAKAGDRTATCSVTINKKVIPVSSITLNKTSLALTKGQSETLTATVKPDDATDKKVTWSSSNTSVATVDQNGKVTAVAGGSATITAKAGDKQATCAVTVTVPVSSVTLNKTELKLKKGTNETLTATIGPEDATNKAIVWSSSDTKIALVDQNGKVTAVDTGTATITVTTNDGSKKATCKVTVPSSGNTEPIVDDGNEQGWD